MPDREKVIKGLEVCRDQDNPPGYRFTSCVDDCPYNGNGCARKLKEDALDLLKEQEAVVRCKDCKHWYFADNRIPSEQENVCGRNGIVVTPDWFCADGIQKEDQGEHDEEKTDNQNASQVAG